MFRYRSSKALFGPISISETDHRDSSVTLGLYTLDALAADAGVPADGQAVPLLALAVITLPVWRLAMPDGPAPVGEMKSGARSPLLGRWLDLLLAVSVEFCLVFWAASAFIAWDRASLSQAPALASLFLVGMATARALSVRIIRRMPDPRLLILACAATAMAGFALFWGAPGLTLAAAGLLVTGLGVALLYPTTVSRVIAAWPQAPDGAAARAALASGLAIGIAPFALAQLSDAIGPRGLSHRPGPAPGARRPRREGLLVFAEVTAEPALEVPTIHPRHPDALSSLRSCDPRFDRPASPVNEAFVL